MNEKMKKFRARIVRGALLKSFLCSLFIASGLLALCAFASWFFGFANGLWLSIGLFFGGLAVAMPLFYVLRFRPDAKDVARRIDALGLEERLITMLELEGDDSYIATVQRTDAQQALATADHTLIKVAASVALCVAVGVAALFGAGALTVNSLYYADVIPSGLAAATEIGEKHTYRVNYTASKGGKVYYWTEDYTGEAFTEEALVKEGEYGPAVVAVPDDGYVFVGWSDGLNDPYRMESGLTHSITVRANFEEIGPLEGMEDSVPISRDADSQSPASEHSTPQPPRPSDSMSDSSPTQNRYQYKDGETYYGDNYTDAYGEALDRLGSENDLPDDLKSGITDYFGSIGRDTSGGD